MNEKFYKTMRGSGSTCIAIGIINAVVGIVSGVILIINGARLLVRKKDILM